MPLCIEKASIGSDGAVIGMLLLREDSIEERCKINMKF